MSNVADRARILAPQSVSDWPETQYVLAVLASHMKPKQLAKAQRQIEKRAAMLETWEGCRLPANVAPIRGWQTSPREQAAASEAQRRERAASAATVRAIIGKVF